MSNRLRAYTNSGCAIEVESLGGIVVKITTPVGAEMLGVLNGVSDTHATFELDGGDLIRVYFDRADCPDAAPEPCPIDNGTDHSVFDHARPRVPDGGPRGFEYSESERADIRDAGRGHLL